MAIVKTQNWQFFLHDQFDDVTRSISLNEQEENGFSYIWTMFSTISRHSTKKRKIC